MKTTFAVMLLALVMIVGLAGCTVSGHGHYHGGHIRVYDSHGYYHHDYCR